MRATLHHIDDVTDNIKTFWFETEQALQWTPGQFTEITLKHPKPDNRGTKRWFTISSSPTEEMPAITTRFTGESSSFKRALQQLAPGQEVDFAEPMGDFVLPKLIQTPLIFVAGGIGVTPIHSMVKWLAVTGEVRDLRFLWAVHDEDDIIFTETWENANLEPTIIVEEPSAEWGGERGRLTAEMILGLEQPSEETLIYLSGPEPMLEALKKDLLKRGLKPHQLVTDFFPGYTGYSD
ncbi:FAD-dependent oxidoreductase [Candidatus Saccharibacteria bacterium]|nr:FAD-dependent oxidoreductase [Candidatus Saccharibacteria bacterium]